MSKLPKKIVTNERSVIEFFSKFPDKAFTIEMLMEEGFSTNIRKVLNRLIEKEMVSKTNIRPEGEGRWVVAYFNSSSLIDFIIEKTEDGWILENVKINGVSIPVEVYKSPIDNSFNLKFNADDFKDVVIYYSELNEKDEKTRILRSIKYSEIEDILDGSDINIEYFFDDERKAQDAVEDSFEIYSENGVRKRISRSKSSVTGPKIQQSFQDLNLDISVDFEKRIIAIRGSQWNESDESDQPIRINSVSLGGWDENAQVYDYIVEDVENIILYY